MNKQFKAARIGCCILNALFGERHERRGLHVKVTDNSVGVFDGSKSLYEAMLFNDPRKDGRVFGNVLDKVIEKAVEKVGVWYAPVFAEQVKEKLAEVC